MNELDKVSKFLHATQSMLRTIRDTKEVIGKDDSGLMSHLNRLEREITKREEIAQDLYNEYSKAFGGAKPLVKSVELQELDGHLTVADGNIVFDGDIAFEGDVVIDVNHVSKAKEYEYTGTELDNAYSDANREIEADWDYTLMDGIENYEDKRGI